jgi:pyrimidine dimer DNA glycosylase
MSRDFQKLFWVRSNARLPLAMELTSLSCKGSCSIVSSTFTNCLMRLWTVHPKYLDAKGLVALWREGLLAQKVLAGGTKGYRRHPQLTRFRAQPNPAAAMAAYLQTVYEEATRRGYRFDHSKIDKRREPRRIAETKGQLMYERTHLLRKLKRRDRELYVALQSIKSPEAHPLFHIIKGDVRTWEKVWRTGGKI